MVKTSHKTLKPDSVEINGYGRWGVGKGPLEVVTVAFGDSPTRSMILKHCDESRRLTRHVWLPLAPEDCFQEGQVFPGGEGLGLYCYWALAWFHCH